MHHRVVGIVVALSLAGFGGCGARSSSGTATVTAVAAVPLEGTVWSGTDSDGDPYTYRFQAGGVLAYDGPSGSFDNATWRQDGARFWLEFNDHYADHEGTIEGDVLVGRARNVAKKTWTYRFTRQP